MQIMAVPPCVPLALAEISDGGSDRAYKSHRNDLTDIDTRLLDGLDHYIHCRKAGI